MALGVGKGVLFREVSSQGLEGFYYKTCVPHCVQVVGRCSRCRTVCVDQGSGERTSEPLQTLLQLRGSRVGTRYHDNTRYHCIEDPYYHDSHH